MLLKLSDLRRVFFDHRDRRRTRLSLTPRGHAFAEWISDSMGGRPDVKNVVPE